MLSAALTLASCNQTTTSKNIDPVANFTGVSASLDMGQLVQPTQKSTDANAGDILTHTWDWGDGSAQSSGDSPTHKYTSTGIFKIKLTTKDDHGGQGTKAFEVTVTAVPVSPADFFSTQSPPTQTKTVDVGTTPQTVIFAGGTQVTLPTDSIVDGSGNPYTGKVVVSVREIRSKSDMILSNVLPFSDDGTPQPADRVKGALISGGMLNLDLATPAGIALNVNPARGVAIKVPAVGPAVKLDEKNPNGMQLFQEQNCKTNPTPRCDTGAQAPAAASGVNWAPVAGHFGINNSTLPGSYVFSVFNKGWINCDYFYSDPRVKGTIHVKFDGINDATTIVFLIPEAINTVIALYTPDGANGRQSYAASLPVGLNAELVAITFNAGKEYLAHKSITVTDGLTENLTFNEATTADIKAYLAAHN